MTETDPSSTRSERDLAARLIAAGSRERPSSHSVERTLSALGLGTAALGASGAATAAAAASSATAVAGSQTATAFGLVTLVKFVALGAAGGLLFAASAERLSSPSEASSRAQALSPRSVNSLPAHRAPKLTERGTVDARRPSKITQPAADFRRPAASGAAPSPEPRFPPVSSSRALPSSAPADSLLAEEIAFVDRGRSAFQRGELATTLAALEGYERSFADARLLPEVLYLRMRALDRSGQTGQAINLARRLVREFPSNPQAASARAILDSSRSR
ncbi:MAG TPA: hypothetical protein VG937_09195 [Polyangiaceae bacterium]|nr:hypothetical protein [Polyangiaceae bacterium]